ncbi:hypothetical protein GCM10010431_38770 [Streptomyces kunmingensis]
MRLEQIGEDEPGRSGAENDHVGRLGGGGPVLTFCHGAELMHRKSTLSPRFT